MIFSLSIYAAFVSVAISVAIDALVSTDRLPFSQD